jgi:SAM-dependent methyltransferase
MGPRLRGDDGKSDRVTDPRTLAAYDRDAAAYAADWHAQPPPADMHALLRQYFTHGPTADIGCGSGRDAAWLAANGFPAIGYDASPGLLAEARRRYPDLAFEQAALPALAAIADSSFANVLCETVIMHLPAEAIAPSVARLVDILAPGGTLYLSWRVADGVDRRDDLGRLYTAFDPALVLGAFGGAAVLRDETANSESSGKLVRRVVARKAPISGVR